jgi:hypothetical protein
LESSYQSYLFVATRFDVLSRLPCQWFLNQPVIPPSLPILRGNLYPGIAGAASAPATHTF